MFGWFSATKAIVVSSGEFFCPSCQKVTKYTLKDIVEKGRLFFIPLQGDVVGSFVECQVCLVACDTEYLRSAPTNDIQVVSAIKKLMLDGASVQEVKAHLAKSGVLESKIDSYTAVASGIDRRRCPQCESIYHTSVANCRKCGVPLPAKSSSH